ncbi:hypothetical protein, partial [Micromonospora sp. WP24]|uniref:hypothetical protein n=1 Tax=Micromonospora sp. WP24 TaxID=2604469 RepID=UPI0016527CA2
TSCWRSSEVNLGITDAPYTGVKPVLADSKTDLYKVNPTYLASNPDPFPGRGAIEQRGFFVFGDGQKNAEFSSPDAVYVTVANAVVDADPSAVVKKLKGNQNELTITVQQTHVNGSKSPVTATFTIHNNASGVYRVGDYQVYVETKGNTQVRKIRIV